MNIRIVRVFLAHKSVAEAVNRLLPQQSPGARSISMRDLEQALGIVFHENWNFRLICAIDGDIPSKSDRCVGMATMFFQRNLGRWVAEIHDVVVDEQYQGLGIDEQLIRTLLSQADHFAADCHQQIKLTLTSSPHREAANVLYLKLGFTLVAQATGEWGGTNMYQKIIEP